MWKKTRSIAIERLGIEPMRLAIPVLVFVALSQALPAAAKPRAVECAGPIAAASSTRPLQKDAAAAPPSDIAYGMNFMWWQVDTSRVPLCAAGQRAATIRNDAFLPRYSEPAIRSAVKSELKQMRESGFTELRTMIAFSPERLATFFDIDTDGTKAGNALNNYVADVAAAGFRHLEIEFGASGTASPSCDGGRCFDPQAVPRTIAFILSVRRALTDTPPVAMSFDLLNEACIWRGRAAQARSNLGEYLRSLVSAYVAAFPKDATTISCGARHFREAKASIDAVYASAGRSGPDYYEAHLYYTTQPRLESVEDAIDEVKASLAGSNIPLVMGETGYGDSRTVNEIADGLRHAGGGLRAIYFWPKMNPSLVCNADVAPPYVLRDALGSK